MTYGLKAPNYLVSVDFVNYTYIESNRTNRIFYLK